MFPQAVDEVVGGGSLDAPADAGAPGTARVSGFGGGEDSVVAVLPAPPPRPRAIWLGPVRGPR